MRRLALCSILLGCSSAATHVAIHAAAAPASIDSCATLGATDAQGRTCAYYDTRAQAFTADPDPLQRRALLYDRYLDLYNNADWQETVRNMKRPFAPGEPESAWGDENQIAYWDDVGDSAGFGDTLMNAVMFRYAVTGADADYARFDSWLRGQVSKFDATGMDGYLARYHFQHVAPGTQIRNGLAMDTGDGFPVTAAARALLPAHYGNDGQWYGHTSIDAYSGPMNSWPLAFPLVRDKALQARMALHYGCFLKRLRIFKIVNLSRNAQLQADIARYLTSGVLNADADDPDLTKVDQVWGFYLPQYNDLSAASYPRDCPAHLATDADPSEVVDVTRTGFEGKLFDLIERQTQDQPNSMDFAFYPSVRASDAVMLLDYALGAYAMTGDGAYLQWRDEILIKGANALEVSRTIGAFQLPRPCRTYYRTPNVYTAHFMATLIDANADSRDFSVMLWNRKFAAKEVAGLRDALFEILFAGATGQRGPNLPQALADLAALGGAPGHLDDPRRNYATDLASSPPPGVTIGKATAQELALCSQPVTVLGLTIPTGSPDPDALYATPAPPVMARPPDNWIWEKSPFSAQRFPGDAGHQQYNGLDFTEPYWEARYFGFLPDTHVVLAWRRGGSSLQ